LLYQSWKKISCCKISSEKTNSSNEYLNDLFGKSHDFIITLYALSKLVKHATTQPKYLVALPAFTLKLEQFQNFLRKILVPLNINSRENQEKIRTKFQKYIKKTKLTQEVKSKILHKTFLKKLKHLENHYSTWTTQTINFSETHVSEEISSDSINSEESDLEENALLEENGFVDGFFVSSN